MQQLLSELYTQTSIQTTLTWITWGMLLIGVIYVRIFTFLNINLMIKIGNIFSK